ncbi:MAG TPA: Fe-S cluster assembly protein SufD [Thermoanaerobaculia bacterium]|nr:Fe-S cluster assembly protein SufD [Thermoanaerobaculia bacterium]
MTAILETTDPIVARLLGLGDGLGEGDPSWIRRLRRIGASRFAALGFPTVRQEAWRFTNVAPLAGIAFARESGHEPSRERIAHLLPDETTNLVVVDGRFSHRLSDVVSVEGLAAGSLADAIRSGTPLLEEHLGGYADAESRPFVALNTALIDDGVFVSVDPGVVVEQPIHLLFITTAGGSPRLSNVRNLILAGAGSQLRLLETYAALDDGGVQFTSSVSEVVAERNATVDHHRLQIESDEAYHIGALRIEAKRDSQVRSHSISLGAALARIDIDAVLAGPGSGCVLDGLYVVRGTQHVDHHTVIDHAQPHCTSQELYKGILDGRSRAVFDGAIIVRKDAQKTSSGQVNRNLLLSEGAVVDSKPQLEIHADDVRCTHGSTIGQLEGEPVFYLRSRGIAEREARNMLTYAFAREVVDRMQIPFVRSIVEEALLERLPGGVGERG